MRALSDYMKIIPVLTLIITCCIHNCFSQHAQYRENVADVYFSCTLSRTFQDMNFGTYYYNAFNPGIGFDIEVNDILQLGGDIQYRKFVLNTVKYAYDKYPDSTIYVFNGGDVSLFSYGLNIKAYVPLEGKFKPYAVGRTALSYTKKRALGYNFMGLSITSVEEEMIQTAMIFEGGAGFDLDIHHYYGLFAEATYVYSNPGKINVSPVTFWSLRLGLFITVRV